MRRAVVASVEIVIENSQKYVASGDVNLQSSNYG
jgi:hypothetical protein